MLIALDTETHLIGPDAVAPKLVCVSLAYVEGEAITKELYAHNDPNLEPLLRHLLSEEEGHTIVGQSIAFDMAVLASYFPDLFHSIRVAYDQQRIHCTIVREKELALSLFGDLKMGSAADGTQYPRHFGLDELCKQYLDIDISESKKAGDSWRLNYSMLDGKSVEEYPDEAREYAMLDAEYTLLVYLHQNEVEGGSLTTHAFHAAADFALFLTTCHGFKIDQEKVAEIQAMLELELAPEKVNLLVDAGILDPGEPPRSKKVGQGMTKGAPPSIKQKPLGDLVVAVCTANGIDITYTDGRVDKATGERVPGICTNAEVIQTIAHLDPILGQYQHRQELQKLVTTEIPRMQAPVVHPRFDVLKETGRTSSSASSLYPSCNIQNIDPRVRPAYVAREGMLILSVDYSSIELVTLAQKLLDIFCESRLADLINQGINPHNFLGAQMAFAFDEEFRQAIDEMHEEDPTRQSIYEAFQSLKSSDDPATQEFFSNYRTFAKPTGLGYPGGLGAETFVSFAKATYGISITLEQAKAFKEVWLNTYDREMERYFKWITDSCKDPQHPGEYCYVSPLGMVRSNASFCAVANGAGMQTPAAEGGKMSYYEVVMACYDREGTDTLSEALYGCRPLAWIHDEILLEIPDDEISHERACAVQEAMAYYMRQITPDVRVSTEAKLMRRWHKQAKPVFDQAGRLVPWQPKTVA